MFNYVRGILLTICNQRIKNVVVYKEMSKIKYSDNIDKSDVTIITTALS